MKAIALVLAGLCMYVLPKAQTPGISSFSPSSGTSGTTVQITGTNFSGATSVNFGGFAIARFTIVDANTILAIVGNGATGNISVTNSSGTANSVAVFTYISKPTTECTWLGTVDSLWNNPANWSCNKIPDASSDVFIPGGTKYGTYCTGNCDAKKLHIGSMNTVDSARYFLNLAYRWLSGDYGYGTRLSMYYTVDNDETAGPSGNLVGTNERRNMARYQTDPTNFDLYTPFRNLYIGISYANYCIRRISKMPRYNNGTIAEKNELKRMYGEALTLKAQFYFDLIRNWGDVPYSEKDFEPNSGYPIYYQLTKSNRDSIYNILINDLGEAEMLLPWRSELASGYIDNVENERITKATAKALRARICLFAGGYSLRSNATMQRPVDYLSYYRVARQECADLMAKRTEHTLTPMYKDLWKNVIGAHLVNDSYGELLFQVKMEGGNSQTDSKMGYYSGPLVNGFGNRSLTMLPTYFYMFDSTDTRRDVTCAPYNVAADGITKLGIASHLINEGKFRRDWISNPAILPTDALQYFGLNWPLIRFADVLLMYAEADNEIVGAPTTDAVAAFNEVRTRAYGSANHNLSPANQSEFFNAIVKERSLEFGSEGIRKYDLIRWNMLGQKLNEAKNNLGFYANHLAPYDQHPLSMYYITNTIADDKAIWYNSLHVPAPVSTPAGTTKIAWYSLANLTTLIDRFAVGYTPGKSELFPFNIDVLTAEPQIVQNPGY